MSILLFKSICISEERFVISIFVIVTFGYICIKISSHECNYITYLVIILILSLKKKIENTILYIASQNVKET